jgi:hypothetical protein
MLRVMLGVHINPVRDAVHKWFNQPWSAPLVLTHLLSSCWVYNNMAACAWQQVTGGRAVGDWTPVAWVSEVPCLLAYLMHVTWLATGSSMCRWPASPG